MMVLAFATSMPFSTMLVASRSISEDMPTLEEVEEFLEMAKDRYGEMIARV